MNTDPTPAGGGMNTDEPVPREEDAPDQDVDAAEETVAVQTASEVMTSEEVTSYSKSVQSTFTKGNYSNRGRSLRSPVKQWNSKWTGYDHFYRPVFTNPYQTPMKVLYRADGKQQVLTVPPMQKAVLSTRMKPGVYSFTSMSGPEGAPPTNVSVGSFSGGGFKPRPGQQGPTKPPATTSIKNALVQVKFAQGTSEPFRVGSLTDLGKDSSMKNATRVLLDGEIPAWGDWSKNDKGEKLFVITETQLLPGVKPPAQEPLPGYNIKLAANQAPKSWLESNKMLVTLAGAGAGLLALGGIGFLVFKRRKSAAEQAETTTLGYSDDTTAVTTADQTETTTPAQTDPIAPDPDAGSDAGQTGATGSQ